jgi:hypothetical protein
MIITPLITEKSDSHKRLVALSHSRYRPVFGGVEHMGGDECQVPLEGFVAHLVLSLAYMVLADDDTGKALGLLRSLGC